MATVTEERFLTTATVLTPDETDRLDQVLDEAPAPVDEHMLSAFVGAPTIQAD